MYKLQFVLARETFNQTEQILLEHTHPSYTHLSSLNESQLIFILFHTS
jgi:hypothetical protein